MQTASAILAAKLYGRGLSSVQIKYVTKDERLHKTRMETFNAIIASYVGIHQNEGKQVADPFIKTILEGAGK